MRKGLSRSRSEVFGPVSVTFTTGGNGRLRMAVRTGTDFGVS